MEESCFLEVIELELILVFYLMRIADFLRNLVHFTTFEELRDRLSYEVIYYVKNLLNLPVVRKELREVPTGG